jgi:hypothetical protein
MTQQQIDELFAHNAAQLDEMNVAAGALVSSLLSELVRKDRRTYIRLHDPAQNGHTIAYDFVEGDASLVGRLARALGFKTVTASTLEVRSG